MRLGVVIAAGGIGARMKAGSSKQLLELAGKPVLARTVDIFERLEAVDQIVIAIDEPDILRCRMEIVDRHAFTKVTSVVAGGKSRAASVLNALGSLDEAIDTVVIHDGARPLFPPGLLQAGLDELAGGKEYDGVVFGVPAVDTMKEVDADSLLVVSTPDRSRLWAAQTPQIFKRQILEEAYGAPRQSLDRATDDAYLVEMAGGKVKMVQATRDNIKITEPLDLVIAAEIIKRREEG